MRYTLVKAGYDYLRDSVNARRYELVVKICFKLAMRVCPINDHVKALMCCLDEFEYQFSGLTLESSLMNFKKNVVVDKGKKVLSSHVV